MALPLTETDKFLLLSAVGAPETRDRISALLDLAGTGNMTGPASATDNALVRFDGATGALVQNSGAVLDDSNNLSGLALLSLTNTRTGNGTVGTPAYSFTSDTNTGMWLGAADELELSTGGSARFRITNAATVNFVPFYAASGSAGAPGIAFNADTDSGIYYSGGAVRHVFGGTEHFQVYGDGLLMASGSQLMVDGSGTGSTAAAPALVFSNLELTTGLYRAAANSIGVSIGGVQRLRFDATSTTITEQVLGPNNNSAAPTYSFTSDPDTGMFRNGSDVLDLVSGGVSRLSVRNSSIVTDVQFLSVDGSAGAPQYSFATDPDTGIYRVLSNRMTLVAGGADILQIDATLGATVVGANVMSTSAGTSSAPGYTFNSDRDTGFYNSAANTIAFATNTAERGSVNGAGLWTLGSSGGTEIHRINGGTATAGADVLTFSNGPTGTAGNPDIYLRLNINGTNYVFPGFAF